MAGVAGIARILDAAFDPRRPPLARRLRSLGLPRLWPYAVAFLLLHPTVMGVSLWMGVIGGGGAVGGLGLFALPLMIARGAPAIIALCLAYGSLARWAAKRPVPDDLRVLPIGQAGWCAAYASLASTVFPAFAALHLLGTAAPFAMMASSTQGEWARGFLAMMAALLAGEMLLLAALHASGAAMVAGSAVAPRAAASGLAALLAFALAWTAWFGGGWWLLWSLVLSANLLFLLSPHAIVAIVLVGGIVAGAVTLMRAYRQLAAGGDSPA